MGVSKNGEELRTQYSEKAKRPADRYRMDRRGAGTTAGSHEAAALNDAKHYDDEGDDEQNVNETAHSVSTDHTQKPQNDQDGGNGLKHTVPFRYVEQEGSGPGAARSLSCPR